MSLRTAMAWVLLTLAASQPAQAQLPFSRDLLPSRSALNRVGLERHWNNVVPMTGTDRVLMISMASTTERVLGTVADSATSTYSFAANAELSPLEGMYINSELIFLDGPLKGQAREITNYSGVQRRFTFTQPWPTPPEKGAKFAILDSLIFVQTTDNNLHTYDGESGERLWTAKLGGPIGRATPASVNSQAVYVTSANYLISLDRHSGEKLWQIHLPAMPTSPTACDENMVLVGLETGRMLAWNVRPPGKKTAAARIYTPRLLPGALPDKSPIDPSSLALLRIPLPVWVWQTDGKFTSRPLPTPRVIAFGAGDGRVYGSFYNTNRLYFRFVTGGPIVAPLASHGVRTLLAPSLDRNVYAIDLFTGNSLWTYPSGSPVAQEPLVAGDEIFVQNTGGLLASLEPKEGTPRWVTSTENGRLVSVSPTKVYLESDNGDLFVVDRKTGTIVDSPRSTYNTKGLDLRSFTIGLTNSTDDRIYFASPSGSLICLREIGQIMPVPLRDLSEKPFGYIPPEGYPDPTAPILPSAPPSANPDSAAPAMEEAKPM